MVKRGKAEKWSVRSERLSAALRENLKKRKDQARQRDLARNRAAADATGPQDDGLKARGPDFRRNGSSK
jgi:hypothetical protein